MLRLLASCGLGFSEPTVNRPSALNVPPPSSLTARIEQSVNTWQSYKNTHPDLPTVTRAIKELTRLNQEAQTSRNPITPAELEKLNRTVATLQHCLNTHLFDNVYQNDSAQRLEQLEQRAAQLLTQPLDEKAAKEIDYLLRDYFDYTEMHTTLALTAPITSPNIDQLMQQSLTFLINESTQITQAVNYLINSINTADFCAVYTRTRDSYTTLVNIFAVISKSIQQTDLQNTFKEQASLLGGPLQIRFNHLKSQQQRDLLNRTPWVKYTCNQAQYGGAGTACACISLATAHTMLTSPNSFWDRGATFGRILEQGRNLFKEAILKRADNVSSATLEYLTTAFLEGGYANIIDKYKHIIKAEEEAEFRQNKVQILREFIKKRDFNDISIRQNIDHNELLSTFIQDGFAALELSMRLEGILNPLIFNKFKTQEFPNILKQTNNFKTADIAQAVVTGVIASASSALHHRGGAFLNLNDEAPVEAFPMERLPDAQGAVRTADYSELLNDMEAHVQRYNAPIAAILQTTSHFFAISMNVDGSVLLSDSLGLRFTRETPFAVAVARDKSDANDLLMLHCPIPRALRIGETSNKMYYLFALNKGQRSEPFVFPAANTRSAPPAPEINYRAFATRKPIDKTTIVSHYHSYADCKQDLVSSRTVAENTLQQLLVNPNAFINDGKNTFETLLQTTDSSMKQKTESPATLVELLQELSLITNEKKLPAGAIIRVDDNYFAVLRNLDGSIFVADSLGFPDVKHPNSTSSFSIALLPNSEAVSSLIDCNKNYFCSIYTAKKEAAGEAVNGYLWQAGKRIHTTPPLDPAKNEDLNQLDALIALLEKFKKTEKKSSDREKIKAQILSFPDQMRKELRDYYLSVKTAEGDKPDVLIAKIKKMKTEIQSMSIK